MSKSTKWVIAGLALSLSFNILVVGFFLGKSVVAPRMNEGFSAGPGGPGGPPPGDVSSGGVNVRTLGQYLSADEKRVARQLLTENRDFLRQKGRLLRQNEHQIRELLKAEIVDTETLALKIEEHQALMRDTNLTMRKVLLEFVATLDLETRRAVAEDLFRRPRLSGDGTPRRFRNRRLPPNGERRPPPDGF